MTRHYPVQVRGTKCCTRCEKTKPKTEFYSNSTMKDGRQSHCGECQRKAMAELRETEPDLVRLARMKNYVKSKYGLTWAAYLEHYNSQKGNCKICGKHFDLLAWRGLHIDHDHKTGRVRGLLCSGCNLGIGHLGDSIPRLEAAIAYLRANLATPSGEN
jgi:hypothetical protein